MIRQRNKFQKDERRQTFILFIALFVSVWEKEERKKKKDTT